MDFLGFSIRMYGVLAALGIGLGVMVVEKAGREVGEDERKLENGYVWVLGMGLAGARLYHVVDYWEYYRESWLEIVAVWQGGLGIYGAIIGGIIGLGVFVIRNYKTERVEKFVKLIDLGVLGLPLGQAVGRWGNYFNQELYGLPTELPWAIAIDPEFRLPGYESVKYYHPLFLYESILNVCLFVWLWWSFRMWKRRGLVGRGKLVGGYLVGYGMIRLVLEQLRIEKWEVGGVATAGIVSVVMIGLGIWLWWGRQLWGCYKRWGLVVLIVGLCGGCGNKEWNWQDTQVSVQQNKEMAEVWVGNEKLEVEVVRTAEKIRLGLGYREEIGAEGMLFVLPAQHRPVYWMKGMRFGLDILWIDCELNQVFERRYDYGECRVVDVSKNIPAPTDPENVDRLERYQPKAEVTHVLEVPMGWASEKVIEVGMAVRVPNFVQGQT